jgi:hypothetical protein
MAQTTKNITVKDQITDFLLYTAPSGNIKVEALMHNENIWLTQDRVIVRKWANF